MATFSFTRQCIVHNDEEAEKLLDALEASKECPIQYEDPYIVMQKMKESSEELRKFLNR